MVAAGHTNASTDQLKNAIDCGLQMFTHLGNACPPQLPRHDNIIQRVLSLSDKLWISYIADGLHLPFFVLKNLLNTAGHSRSVIVSDAISAAECKAGCYTLGDQSIEIKEDGVSQSADGSHLIGSTTSLATMYQNLINNLGLTKEQAEELTFSIHRKFLGYEEIDKRNLKVLRSCLYCCSVVRDREVFFPILMWEPVWVFHDLVAGFSFPDDDFGNLTRCSDRITVKGHSVSVHHKGFISRKWVNFGNHCFRNYAVFSVYQ